MTVHTSEDGTITVVTGEFASGTECEQGCVNLFGRTFHPANRPHDHGLDGRRYADDLAPPTHQPVVTADDMVILNRTVRWDQIAPGVAANADAIDIPLPGQNVTIEGAIFLGPHDTFGVTFGPERVEVDPEGFFVDYVADLQIDPTVDDPIRLCGCGTFHRASERCGTL